MSCTCNLEIKRIINILIRTSTRYDTDRHRDPWTIASEKYRVETVIEPLAKYAKFLLEQLERDNYTEFLFETVIEQLERLNFYLKL